MTKVFERKFIFLSPEDKGYEITPGKTPRGHIEIERKGSKLSFKVFLENLKEMTYQIQLFTFGGSYVVLDEIYIEESGKIQGNYSTSSTNILSSDIDWREIDLIVIRPMGETHSRRVALAAWLNNQSKKKEIPHMEEEGEKEYESWDELGDIEGRDIVDEPDETAYIGELEELEGTKEIDEVGEIEDIRELEIIEEIEEIGEVGEIERIEDIERLKEIGIIEDEEDKIIENISMEEAGFEKEFIELEEPDEAEEIDKSEETEEIDEPEEVEGSETMYLEDYWVDLDQEELEQPEQPLEPSYYYINQNIEYMEKNLPETRPFDPPLKNHRWWVIEEDKDLLKKFYLYFNGSFTNLTYPYMGYRNIGEEHIDRAYDKIFGLVFEEDSGGDQGRYFVYGILGRLCSQEQPFQGSTGFLYWHPIKGSKYEEGELGYWLLYIEADSGIIAIPKRPTIAPDCLD